MKKPNRQSHSVGEMIRVTARGIATSKDLQIESKDMSGVLRVGLSAGLALALAMRPLRRAYKAGEFT